MVDPIGKRVEAFQRDSDEGGYRAMSIADTIEFHLAVDCVAKLDVAGLFRELSFG